MNDVSTLNADNARAVVTDASRKDAASSAGSPAREGQGGGKTLPPASASDSSTAVSNRVAGNTQRVERAIAKLNDYVQSFQRDLRFSVDEELGRPIVRVIDRSTQEVIRQIPSDVAIRLARNLNDIKEVQEVQEQQVSGRYAGDTAAANRLGLVNTRI